jgi:hypothetical protein
VESIRYGNIGIGVAAVIIVAGVLIFKDSSEAAMQASALVGTFAGLAVALILMDRAERRKRRRQ